MSIHYSTHAAQQARAASPREVAAGLPFGEARLGLRRQAGRRRRGCACPRRRVLRLLGVCARLLSEG